MKKWICVVLLVLVISPCTSCTNNTTQNVSQDYIYNGLSTYWLTSNEDYIFTSFSNNIQMTDKHTGQVFDFIRDPFFEQDEDFTPIGYIFADEQNVYYLMSEDNSSYKIVRRDNETLKETIIYEKDLYQEQTNIFLGAAQTTSPDRSDILNSIIPSRFCVIGNSLFLFPEENILEINLLTKTERVICTEGLYNDNYSYYKDILYFVNSAYDICCYNIKTQKMNKLDNYKAQTILVTPQGLYFSNAADGGKLHYIDFNFRWHKKLTDVSVNTMDFDHEYIYYLTEGGDTVYRMNLYGGEAKELISQSGLFDLHCDRNGRILYMLRTDETGVFTICKHKI